MRFWLLPLRDLRIIAQYANPCEHHSLATILQITLDTIEIIVIRIQDGSSTVISLVHKC